jgi:hypothetical protein
MNPTRRRGWTRVTGVVLTTLAAIYLINLGNLVLANRRAKAVEHVVREELRRDADVVSAVETETSRAAGDAYVEQFARDEMKWVQPGDHVVVPIPVEATPLPPDASSGEDRPGLLDRVRGWLEGDR